MQQAVNEGIQTTSLDRRSIGIINLGVLTDGTAGEDMMSSRRHLGKVVASGRNEQVALQDLLKRHIDENTMIKVPRVTVNFLSGPGNQKYMMHGIEEGALKRRQEQEEL